MHPDPANSVMPYPCQPSARRTPFKLHSTLPRYHQANSSGLWPNCDWIQISYRSLSDSDGSSHQIKRFQIQILLSLRLDGAKMPGRPLDVGTPFLHAQLIRFSKCQPLLKRTNKSTDPRSWWSSNRSTQRTWRDDRSYHFTHFSSPDCYHQYRFSEQL